MQKATKAEWESLILIQLHLLLAIVWSSEVKCTQTTASQNYLYAFMGDGVVVVSLLRLKKSGK